MEKTLIEEIEELAGGQFEEVCGLENLAEINSDDVSELARLQYEEAIENERILEEFTDASSA